MDTPASSLPPLSSSKRARLLLVDDHPANLVALEAILEPLHQILVRATSGEQALKELLNPDFAAILLDVQMPGLDGFQTAELIRARSRTRAIPILFLTAYSKEPSQVFRGYRTGAVDYLVKPFDPDILRSKVSVFVDLYLAREQARLAGELLLEKEREAHERRSAERYQQLLDSMPLAAWAERDGRVLLVNRYLRDYVGELDPGDGISAVMHDDDRPRWADAWASARQTGKRVQIEVRLRCVRDQSHRWFLVRMVAERDGNDVAGGSWIGTGTDIEDHKRDQAALREANAAKDEFIAAASHELRTPLAAAKAQAQLARRRLGSEGDAKAIAALDVIGRQIDRIAKLVEDLLDLSRMQTGRISLSLSPFDLAPLLHDVVERIQALTEKHRIEVASVNRLEMVGDRDRIEQVVTNLLTNAVRYSPDGGPIRVEAREEASDVHIVVRDRGLGIPKDKHAEIFERFKRAHGTKFGGLGLGLAIAQGIVQQHGGSISVESTGVPGQGSVFDVRLPKHPPQRPSAA